MIVWPALAAVVAQAAPVALPFAPPLDRPLRYRMVQTLGEGPRARRFTMDRELVFTRSGTGYRATLRVTRFSAEAPPAVGAVFEAGMAPFRDVPVIVELSADGIPGAVIDAAATWAKVVASYDGVLAAMAERPDATPAVLDGLRAYFRSLTALPDDQRDARLREGVEALLGQERPLLRPGESREEKGELPSPLGGTMRITGTIRLDRADAEQASYSLSTRSDPADLDRMAKAIEGQAGAPARPELGEESELSFSRHTGLLLSSRATKIITAAGQRRTVHEELTLVP